MSQSIITLGGASRRSFIANCAAAASLPLLSGLPVNVFAAGDSKPLKVGVIGAGGRGSGAVADILEASKLSKIPVQIWAVGDAFMKSAKGLGERRGVPAERIFDGLDNHLKVLETGVDVVILTAPPGYRPQHFKAAVEKGVHVFAEKAVAVDPFGVAQFIKDGEIAAQKKLSVVAGTQRRHQKHYVEAIKRIRDGEIGEIVSGQVYWMGGELWHRGGTDITDLQYQLRNWLYFTWLSGDHIVEQHVHNIDIANWAIGANPVNANAMGGRQVRVLKKYGDAFDHFSVDYEYPNGVRILSFCRQSNNTSSNVSERFVGTKGVVELSSSGGSLRLHGSSDRKKFGGGINGYVQEHIDLLESITGKGPYLNEARTVAESTLAGVMGRMSAYTGGRLSWNFVVKSSLNLFPENLNGFGPGTAPGVRVAIPGKTRVTDVAPFGKYVPNDNYGA
ncbi:MAG: Gfo/Idh/MocA family oxidoreductase [Puniceicoccales bacterium]|jgi:predicted dehydrogenase|nr:Gfo/Idh/MocA family oxidoreductase [Puniceicoccales bacterium]